MAGLDAGANSGAGGAGALTSIARAHATQALEQVVGTGGGWVVVGVRLRVGWGVWWLRVVTSDSGGESGCRTRGIGRI